MKKALIVILIVILVLAVLTVAGLLAYRHFVTERIMDKGGIKNPFVEKEPDDFEEPEDPGPIEMLDGDYTYVDNGMLLPVLAGTWESTDGRYAMTLTEEYQILLTLDGETVLEDTYNFTYLQPGYVSFTDLLLSKTELTQPDGTVCQICDLHHEVSDSDENGRIVMVLMRDSFDTEEIEFKKQ